jgi:hypothetical protein
MVIKQFVNQGFKDEFRSFDLSGLDIFTSDNVNGTGKSAVLEGVKLALLGEIPGKAKTVEDILTFTSKPEMKVAVTAETGMGLTTVARRFCRHAAKGEKRLVGINGVARGFEDGDRWIREHIGAVSVNFNPFEFLHLSDGGKRQWILEISPESRFLGAQQLRTLLVVRIMESHFGSAFVRSLLKARNISDPKWLLSCQGRMPTEVFPDDLAGYVAAALKAQDAVLFRETETLLDRLFSAWDESLTAGQNIDSMLNGLRAEVSRLRLLAREMPDRQGIEDDSKSAGEMAGKIEMIRKRVEILENETQQAAARRQRLRETASARKQAAERIGFLRTALAGRADGGDDDSVDRLKSEIHILQAKIADTSPLVAGVKRLAEELRRGSENHRERETLCSSLRDELRESERRLAALEALKPGCPLAREIECKTDLSPLRNLLANKNRDLENGLKAAMERLKAAEAEVLEATERLEKAQEELGNRKRDNAATSREIDRLKEQLAAAEKKKAHAEGMLTVYARELEALVAAEEARPEDLEEQVEEQELEAKMRRFDAERQKASRTLMELAREQGRRDAAQEALDRGGKAETALRTARLVKRLLGPDGVQGELARLVSQALEEETNRCLKMIHPDYDFSIDLTSKKFRMGWQRQGKLIPLTTINSAHFVMFVAPFLTAAINRLARVREKLRLPTVRALCVEAEALTPANLILLLQGLAEMRRAGFLDNVLVAHYCSLRDPAKLCGFKEHILGLDRMNRGHEECWRRFPPHSHGEAAGHP